MNNLLKSAVLVGLMMTAGHANANEVKVYWDDPSKFTDIVAGVESEATFPQRVMDSLDKHFAKLGDKLPRGYTWEIRVSDVDLAGKVTSAYWNGREALRVMDTFFNPSITISYLVKDGNGKIVAGDKNFALTDAYVKKYPSDRFMQRPLSYEKYMIKSWFNKVLLPFVENS